MFLHCRLPFGVLPELATTLWLLPAVVVALGACALFAGGSAQSAARLVSPWTPRAPLPSATCITPERVRTRDPCAARGVSRGEVHTGAGPVQALPPGSKLCAGVRPPFFLPLPQPTVLAPLSAAFRRLWWPRGHTVRAARSISGFESNRIQDLSPAHFDARAEA